LTVVSRGPATAVAGDGYGAYPSTAHEPPGSDPGDWSLIRPARFAVTRVLKGSLPECVDLDVPGGSSPDFVQQGGGEPPPFGVGARMLAFFLAAHADDGSVVAAPRRPSPPKEVPPFTAWLILVAPDGTAQILGGSETINVDTWTPPS
jgi:hypothetical protein